jgi:uncharacterized membrane protein YbhN (UPF0104 family)
VIPSRVTGEAPQRAPATAEEELSIRRFGNRWRLLLLLALAGLLVVGVFLLVSRVAGYADTLDRLQDANPVWLAVCFGSQAVFYGCFVTIVRALGWVRGGPRMPLWLTVRLSFAALGATRLFAAGGAGGLAVVYWAYRQAGLERRTAAVRVLAINVILYAAFGAAVLVAALFALVGLGDGVPRTMALPWAVVVGALACLGAYVTSSSRAQRLIAADGAGRLRSMLGVAVEAAVLVRRMAEDRRANRATLVAGPLYWAADMSCLWAALRAFDVHLSVVALVLAYATGFLANMIPLPTGGIGGVDAATTFALTAVGVPLAPALLGVFAYRFFSFLLPTLPAIVALPTISRMGRELRALAPS